MQLSGWGRVPRVEAEIIHPKDRRACAPQSPLLARGLGRSYGDASLPAPGARSMDLRPLNRILALDPESGVVEAEAGVSLREILAVALPRGLFPPVTPGTQWVTLGGAAASNIHGKNHHRRGSIEHCLESLEVATPTGTFTCSPEENAELFRATVGGYGLTGVITRLRLRLMRSPAAVRMRALRCRGAEALFEAFRRHDSDHEYSVAWIDTLGGQGHGVLFLGDPAEGAGPRDSRERAGRGRHELFRVPFPLPPGLLHPAALRLFNALYYRLPRPASERIVPYASFFYPLDRIGNWNLLYGPRGFFQYQCVLPDPGSEEAVAEILRFLAKHGLGSFLAVLKRCGDDNVLLPFCKRGYTLALDIPNRGPETLRKLDELDARVADRGGRVYLTKDARLSPEMFRRQYPEWRDWMAAVKRYNPDGLCRSLLSERLKLWDA